MLNVSIRRPVPVRPLKQWSLKWWQMAHQTRLREPPHDDPTFLAQLYDDQRSSEVVLGVSDLVILGSNPILALAAAAHCSTFCSSIVVALGKSPDHWNYPLATTPLFARFVHRHVGGTDQHDLGRMALDWTSRLHPGCSVGWVDVTQKDWFHMSRDEPTGLMLGMWGLPQHDKDPWAREDQAPLASTQAAYEQVWSACRPALDQLERLPFPAHPVWCEGPDRPAHLLVSKNVLLVSSLPHRLSQTVRTTDEGLHLSNEWDLPALGSSAFLSTSARGHFDAPLRDLTMIKRFNATMLPSSSAWPDAL